MKLKRVLFKPVAIFFMLIAVFVVFFEEWLWFRLLKVMNAITSLPFVKGIDGFVRRQNKWVSIFLFLIPELIFVPIKFGVVWLFGNNHYYTGILVFVFAKIAGTALFAWTYSTTEPKITEFAFVRFIRDKILAIRSWAHAWLNANQYYQEAKTYVIEFKTQFKESKESFLKRKFSAAHQLAKKKLNLKNQT